MARCIIVSVEREERVQAVEVISTGVAGESWRTSLAARKTNPGRKGGQPFKCLTSILPILGPYVPAGQKAEVVGVAVQGGVLDTSMSAVQKVGMRLVRLLVDPRRVDFCGIKGVLWEGCCNDCRRVVERFVLLPLCMLE